MEVNMTYYKTEHAHSGTLFTEVILGAAFNNEDIAGRARGQLPHMY